MLQLIDLNFSYPTCQLALNLSVRAGARLALCGDSGIGKTTTLNLIAGFLTPWNGDILWQQKSIVDLSFKDRPVALLTQADNVFNHLNVLDNIELGKYSLLNNTRKHFWDELDQLIDVLQLTPWLNHKVDLLSGGQKQRVALIRLISQRQKLWLMDEPFNGLDDNIKAVAYRILMEWQTKMQATIIFTSHHRNEIAQFATNVCHLRKINGLIEIDS